MPTKELDVLLDEIKRTEAVEFGYACAFLIDECPTTEGVTDVYDKWDKETKPKKLTFAVNALGTKFMCDYAKSHNCKHFIFTGSVTVYGIKTLGENHDEYNVKRKFR